MKKEQGSQNLSTCNLFGNKIEETLVSINSRLESSYFEKKQHCMIRTLVRNSLHRGLIICFPNELASPSPLRTLCFCNNSSFSLESINQNWEQCWDNNFFLLCNYTFFINSNLKHSLKHPEFPYFTIYSSGLPKNDKTDEKENTEVNKDLLELD
jgi:hypothetical protein